MTIPAEADRPIAWIKASEEDKAKLAEARSRTLWQALSDAAALDPDKTALVAADDEGVVQRLTYGALLDRVRAFSAGLAGIGVKRGDRVVLWMTNRLEWVISCFAVARIGAAVVPINTFLKPPEVRYCIAQSGARHLIMLDRFRKVDMPAMLAEICSEFGVATEPGALSSRDLPELCNVVMFAREGRRHPAVYDWNELEAPHSDWLAEADRMTETVTPDDLMMVKYTSGSTGFPKGVMLQQGGFVANGILHAARTGMSRSDVYFSMMPLFHAGGSIYGLMSMLPQGGTLVFTEAFSVELAVRLIEQEQATIFIGVLGKEVAMAAHEQGITFPSLWMGHVHNDVARAVMPNVRFAFSPFGLTETYAPASLTGPGDPPEKWSTTGGRPLPGNEIRVVDPETGRDCAPDEIGEAWIRGNLMLGYWNKPEETARAIDAEGWLHSEDLVSIDEDGFVTFSGRLKLMAKVAGENVSLEEVERTVTGHEAITHCAAVSVADPRKVEAVRIYVVRREEMAICADELLGWLKPRLAHFKLPREIVFVDDLPRLGSAKLDRLTLAEWAKRDVTASDPIEVACRSAAHEVVPVYRKQPDKPMADDTPSDEAVFDHFHDVHIDRDNMAHYRALMQRRLVLNRCGDCGRWIYPHRPMCPACLSWNVAAAEVSGRGKLYMYTLLQQSRDPDKPLDEPLQVAAVELAEQPGLRYLSQVVECPVEALRHDMRVQLTWIEHGGRRWPAFRPASD